MWQEYNLSGDCRHKTETSYQVIPENDKGGEWWHNSMLSLFFLSLSIFTAELYLPSGGPGSPLTCLFCIPVEIDDATLIVCLLYEINIKNIYAAFRRDF